MRKYINILLWVVVCLAGLGYFILTNAMAEETELQETADAQLSSAESVAENTIEDEMNAKVQKTKKLQGKIEKEQEDRMIKDVQKGMLR